MEITKMINDTVVRVLSRPRFRVQVELIGMTQTGEDRMLKPSLQYSYTVRYEQDQYHMKINGFEKETYVVVSKVEKDEVYKGYEIFFFKSVKHKKLDQIRKIGICLANKMKMRMYHEIMAP